MTARAATHPKAASQNTSWWFRWRAEAIYVFLIPLGIVVLLATPTNFPTEVDILFSFLAWSFFVAGTALRFWALLYIGGRKRSVLVDRGPYSLCRNPLYLGTLFYAFALALYLKSLTFAAGAAAASMVYTFSVVPTEERYLLEKLGDVYKGYCAHTPRFLPRFSLYKTDDTIEVRLKPLQREFSRACLSTFWIPLTSLLFNYVHQLSWWPRMFWLP